MESVGVVVTNHRQLITHVNKVFAKNTGYSLGELVGRNCKLLQGSETDPEAVRCIRIALEAAEPVEVRLLNYKKDGTAFWSLLRILPLLDGQGRVDGYVGLSVCLGSRFVDQPLSLLRWISPAVLDKQKNQGFVRRGRKLLETEEEVKTCRHISFVAETNLPTRQGVFRVRAYRDEAAKTEPMAIISGDVRGLTEVPVRVHDQCFTSEVLGSLKCDCKEQLHAAMEYIKNNPPGIVIYLQQEGRGMGLANKIKAYSLQEFGYDTVDANHVLGFEDDTREYEAAAAILEELGVASIRLMTNNPRKIQELESLGVSIAGRISVIMESNMHSDAYLRAKEVRMGHVLSE